MVTWKGGVRIYGRETVHLHLKAVDVVCQIIPSGSTMLRNVPHVQGEDGVQCRVTDTGTGTGTRIRNVGQASLNSTHVVL